MQRAESVLTQQGQVERGQFECQKKLNQQVIRTPEDLVRVAKNNPGFFLFGHGSVAKTVTRFLLRPDNNLPPSLIIAQPTRRPPKAIKGVAVKPLKKCRRINVKTLVIVALRDFQREAAKKILAEHGFTNVVCIHDMTFIELCRAENIRMNFMCVGFTKCGTTSLDVALKKNKKLYLSKQKETNYMYWRDSYDDSPERFVRMYYPNWKKRKIIGNIEPTYHRKSQAVYECFGNDMKLIFMMRNPVDATYSYFKMKMRRTKYKHQVMYYLKHKKFQADMFDEYINDYVLSGRDNRFKYDVFINEYLELWTKDNMKFVFFEDILANTSERMNEIQEFIGVAPVNIPAFPPVNIGSTVSKNFICAMVNAIIYRGKLRLKAIPSKKIKTMYKRMNAWVWKFTQVESHEKMNEHSRQILTEFYMDSIKRVEKITGQCLKGVWY